MNDFRSAISQQFFRRILIGILGATAVRANDEAALPKDIAREVVEAEIGPKSGDLPILERWDEARVKLKKNIGLSWTASYHSLGLAAAGGDGVPAGASGDLTVQGIWTPGQRWVENPTELRFRFRDRRAYGATSASGVSNEVGALWGVVDGFSDSGFEVPDFYLRHVFDRPGIDLRYGQMAIDSQFGGHQFSSSKKYFLNQAFSSDPAVAFPRFGAGLTIEKSFDNGLAVGVGATTVQGTTAGDQVDFKFNSSDLFEVLQLSYDLKDGENPPQRFVLLGWHSDGLEDVSQPAGQGAQFIYERALDEDGARLVSSVAWSSGGAAPLDLFFNFGVGMPWRDRDTIGVAAGIGRGSGPDGTVQSVVEGFYRWQPLKNLQVTPDVQLLLGEGLEGAPGVRVIGGIRLGLSF
ncbi:MAG: hypothetical protein KDN05_04390 [Verrucomicrobiae bacterium]|nr:hypothetical protein [Verrucomicrobiae bacterium]MCP5548796.1 hypothetical protein [Akkermansiaceae bacterium]